MQTAECVHSGIVRISLALLPDSPGGRKKLGRIGGKRVKMRGKAVCHCAVGSWEYRHGRASMVPATIQSNIGIAIAIKMKDLGGVSLPDGTV